jgi:hypothetical protein
VSHPLSVAPTDDEGEPARPGLRIRPAPPTEPPFDADPQWMRPALHPVPDPRREPELPIVWARRRPSGGTGRGRAGNRGCRGTAGRNPPPGPPAGGSPEARRAARYFLAVYQEVLRGQRPLRHLVRLSTVDGLRCVAHDLGSSGPRRTRRTRLLSLHLAEPRDGIAEVAAVLTDGDRAWAVALSFERRGTAWLCAYFVTV